MPGDDIPPDPKGPPGPDPRQGAEFSEAQTKQFAEVTQTDISTDTELHGVPDQVEATDETVEVLAPGRLVDQYKIVRFLGHGGMSEVYLARDVGLGRKVAIKVLHPRALGSEEAVERFLFEARATARFSFPHIVTIHAVGEYKGYPYLALEYLDGQSLAERIRDTKLHTQEAVRFGLAVAEALQEAHRNRILHRDLKPANVMIPRDGRVRVVDFGLAKRAEVAAVDRGGQDAAGATASVSFGAEETFQTAAEGVRGTPAYMAPEQWNNDPLSGATDVWALGLLLYEMLDRRQPLTGLEVVQICSLLFEPEPLPPPARELPAELHDLIVRCIDKIPSRRPPIGEVVETLRGLLRGRRTAADEGASPFRGLLPLEERHADRFFGRDAEIAAFVERLRGEPVLPVIGPSGSGKSSFVQAGIVPRLQEQGRWLVLRLRPGPRPYLALATRLLTGGSSRFSSGGGTRQGSGNGEREAPRLDWDAAEQALVDELGRSPASLAVKLGELAEARKARVLLFVDQLEELYTLSDDAGAARTFMEAVCLAADDRQGPVRVIFTLREDFLGRLAMGPASRAALGRATVLVTPGPEALAEIVQRTVDEAGYEFDDPDLVPRIVDEIRDEPAALPMLQFAGTTLWERRDEPRRLLLRAVYEEMGGVAGCTAHHAEGLLEALSPQQVRIARSILLRLVTTEGTRRVVPRGRLLEGLGAGGLDVLDSLVQGRAVMVRKSYSGGDEEAEYELVHESLVQSWTRLARWIDESREELAFLAEVEQAVDLWERRGRRQDEVWGGEALREAQRQVQRMEAEVPERVRRFLEAGEQRARDQRAQARTRWATVAVLVVVVGLTSAFLVNHFAGPARLCAEPERRLDGVWDAPARADVRAALTAVDRPYAADTHALLEPVLDGYADDWVAMYTDACEATHVRGEQSEHVLDLRMACLERRRAGFAALIDLLSHDVDGELLDQSVSAAYDLTPLRACADVDLLAAAVPPPEDPRVAAQVEELREQLDRAAALEKLGRYQAGLEVADPTADEAEALDYAPVQAEAQYQLGVLHERQGNYEEALEILLRAAEAAARAHDDGLIARIWVDLILVVGDRMAQPEQGLVYHELAAVAVTRAGGDRVLEAQMLHNLGNVTMVQGKYEEARANYTKSMELRIEVLGEDHPDVAASLNNLGLAVGNLGEYEQARAYLAQSLEIKRRSIGPDHPDVAASLNNLGIIQTYTKDHDGAAASYEEAYRILENAMGPEHGDLALLLNNLGHVAELGGRYDEAWEHHERSLALRRAQLGEDHPDVGTSLLNMGVARAGQGRCEEALPLFAEALALWSSAYRPGHPAPAYALTAQGDCLLDLGRPGEAVAPLREAVRLRTEADADPAMLAMSRFFLARALWDAGQDRAGAVALADQVREFYATEPELYADELARADAWLAGDR